MQGVKMQIVYFPYLFLGNLDEVGFGDIKVWNFEKKAEEYLPDNGLREHIKKIIFSNISHNQSIKDVGILSIGETDFREFNEGEFAVANEVRLVLFLSFLAIHNTLERGGNTGWFMGTSENFEFVVQNFQPENDYISERSGTIVPIMTGGYRIGEKKFYKPSHVINYQRFSLDPLLIKELFRLKKRSGKRFYRRVLRATDLIFESYYNNPNISINARVLLQIAAFEVILSLPSSGQRRAFKEKIERYCNLVNEKLYVHWFEIPRGRIKDRNKRSRKVIWADAYYTLRNHIIHGDRVNPKEFIFKGKQRHLDIAILFFVLLIKKMINEKQNKKIFYDEIEWGKTIDGDDVYEGFIYKDRELARIIALSLSRSRR